MKINVQKDYLWQISLSPFSLQRLNPGCVFRANLMFPAAPVFVTGVGSAFCSTKGRAVLPLP